MPTLTVSDSTYQRLKSMAEARRVPLEKLLADVATADVPTPIPVSGSLLSTHGLQVIRGEAGSPMTIGLPRRAVVQRLEPISERLTEASRQPPELRAVLVLWESPPALKTASKGAPELEMVRRLEVLG